MALDVKGVTNALISHAMATGVFDRVAGHEPKNAPGLGVTGALWVEGLRPLPEESGLNSTTGLLEYRFRVYNSALSEPRDDIDPTVLAAVDALFTAYTGDFTLGGLVRNVDLLHVHSEGLAARAGYVTVGQTMYRCMDITLPVIINDLWTQAA